MQTHAQQKPKNLKARFMKWLGLTNEVTIKLYHGYGHGDQLMIYGHVFRLGPTPRKRYRKSFLRNTWALLRLFIVKPYPCLQLELQWKNEIYFSATDKDGFFKFEWKGQPPLPQGWSQVVVRAKINDLLI